MRDFLDIWNICEIMRLVAGGIWLLTCNKKSV